MQGVGCSGESPGRCERAPQAPDNAPSNEFSPAVREFKHGKHRNECAAKAVSVSCSRPKPRPASAAQEAESRASFADACAAAGDTRNRLNAAARLPAAKERKQKIGNVPAFLQQARAKLDAILSDQACLTYHLLAQLIKVCQAQQRQRPCTRFVT